MRLIDTYGREITSLRFSITNHCNLACIYCHMEGEEKESEKRKEKKEEISAEKVIAIAKVAYSHFGIKRIKFSGGEPLLRKDLVDIIQGLRDFEDDISLTTNGVFLRECAEDLAEAGLDRVNVSLDSLKEERYNFITNSENNFPKVLDGIHSAIEVSLIPIKLNMVILKRINEDEILDMMDFVRERAPASGLILQIIEIIENFGTSMRSRSYGVELLKVEKMIRAKASSIKIREMHRRKKYVVDGVEIEIVRPMDNTEFCANCSRLRVTSDGKIKPCLLRNDNLISVDSIEEEHIVKRMKDAMKYREPFCNLLHSQVFV